MSGNENQRWSRSTRGVTLAVALAIILPRPLIGQLNGVPIWSPGLPVAPLETAVMAHTSSGADFLGDTGAEWGGTISLRAMFADRVTITGGVGALPRDVGVGERTWKPQYFASAAFHLVHGTDAVGDYEYGLAVLGGWGVSTLPGDADEQNIPLGLDLVGHFNQGGWYVEASVLPRWAWRRTDLGAGGKWQNGPGLTDTLSAGTSFSIALIAAVDKTWLDATAGAAGLPETNPVSWSIGLRWVW